MVETTSAARRLGCDTPRRSTSCSYASAGKGAPKHDQSSKVTITDWFDDGDHVCVEYVHRFVIFPKSLRLDGMIDRYCLVFHIRDGKFDVIREYINPSNVVTSFLVLLLLRLLPLIATLQKR